MALCIIRMNINISNEADQVLPVINVISQHVKFQLLAKQVPL